MVRFPDGSYLELIAPLSSANPHVAMNHPWARFLTGNAGPCAWAVSTGDLDCELRRLHSAGIPVSPPAANGRRRPDGVRLEWKTATSGAAVSFFPFWIQDLTPREWRAFPQGAPGNRDFHGIARVVLAVRDLDTSLARYLQALRPRRRQRANGPRIPRENRRALRRTHGVGAAARRRFLAGVAAGTVRGSALRGINRGRRNCARHWPQRQPLVRSSYPLVR